MPWMWTWMSIWFDIHFCCAAYFRIRDWKVHFLAIEKSWCGDGALVRIIQTFEESWKRQQSAIRPPDDLDSSDDKICAYTKISRYMSDLDRSAPGGSNNENKKLDIHQLLNGSGKIDSIPMNVPVLEYWEKQNQSIQCIVDIVCLPCKTRICMNHFAFHIHSYPPSSYNFSKNRCVSINIQWIPGVDALFSLFRTWFLWNLLVNQSMLIDPNLQRKILGSFSITS